MRIFLVRHGESLANVDLSVYKNVAAHAVPLSQEGVRQANDAGNFLKEYYAGLDQPDCKIRLWYSPYVRARQTAREIETVMGYRADGGLLGDKREDCRIAEQQFGLFDGLTEEEAEVLYPNEFGYMRRCQQHQGKFWARYPLGESRFDVVNRAHDMMTGLIRDAEKDGIEDVIIVSHGVTMRALCKELLNKDIDWFEMQKNPENGSIHMLESAGGVYYDRGRVFTGSGYQQPPRNSVAELPVELINSEDGRGARHLA